MERECNVSCVYAVRGCTDPVAGACCQSHLQNDHGLDCLGPGGGMDQPVQGPWHGHKGNAWVHPYTSWFMIPRLVRRPVHVPWPRFFFSHAALYCTLVSGPPLQCAGPTPQTSGPPLQCAGPTPQTSRPGPPLESDTPFGFYNVL